MSWPLRAATVSVLLLGFATLGVATDGFRAITSEGARRVDVRRSPRAIPDVRMVDHLGREIGWRDFAGGSVLVEFIFTTCPDICQRMSTEMGALVRADSAGHNGGPAFLSITFDPANDTVEQLRGVAEYYGADGERWRFVRIADAGELGRTLEAFGVVVLENPVRGFEHNAAIHGVDPQGRLARIDDISQSEQMLRWARDETLVN